MVYLEKQGIVLLRALIALRKGRLKAFIRPYELHKALKGPYKALKGLIKLYQGLTKALIIPTVDPNSSGIALMHH